MHVHTYTGKELNTLQVEITGRVRKCQDFLSGLVYSSQDSVGFKNNNMETYIAVFDRLLVPIRLRATTMAIWSLLKPIKETLYLACPSIIRGSFFYAVSTFSYLYHSCRIFFCKNIREFKQYALTHDIRSL